MENGRSSTSLERLVRTSEFVLLFQPNQYYMDQKSIVAVVRTWEGVKVNWSLIIQQKCMKKYKPKEHVAQLCYIFIQRLLFLVCFKISTQELM